jgi:hypothetical protein
VCPAFDRGFCTPLACMVSVDQVQIVDASTRLLASIWFSRTRHLTVVPYFPSPFSHPRFTPTYSATFMRPTAEFDILPSWLLKPRPFWLTYLLMPLPPTYEAYAQAFWQARIRLAGLFEWPNGSQPSPLSPAAVEYRAVPFLRFGQEFVARQSISVWVQGRTKRRSHARWKILPLVERRPESLSRT